mgnify:CR=1 FL=1
MNKNTLEQGSMGKTVIIAVVVGLVVAAVGLTMVKSNKKVDQATTAMMEGTPTTEKEAAKLR